VRKRVTKSRSIIALEDVPAVFDAVRIRKLATIAKVPPDADMNAFGAAVRGAARIFARDARVPTDNELHDEIAALLKASEGRWYDDVARLLEKLSPRARDMLCDATPSLEIELPLPNALRDVERREAACAAIVSLCQFDGRFVKGRRRPSGKRSRPLWQPYLYAPERRRHFPKREAERDFVMWLSIAWCNATGAAPPRTARHPDATRDVGPFARFVRECLRLVGAGYADVVELINEVHRRRRGVKRARPMGRQKIAVRQQSLTTAARQRT
jgi:hypothetical protein